MYVFLDVGESSVQFDRNDSLEMTIPHRSCSLVCMRRVFESQVL